MTETTHSTPLTSAPGAGLMFPTLTPAQIARIASHGVIRPITAGKC
jgi:thioredoxin reductase (NADPH)